MQHSEMKQDIGTLEINTRLDWNREPVTELMMNFAVYVVCGTQPLYKRKNNDIPDPDTCLFEMNIPAP